MDPASEPVFVLDAEGLEAKVMENGGANVSSGEAWLAVPLRSGSASQHGPSACIPSHILSLRYRRSPNPLYHPAIF